MESVITAPNIETVVCTSKKEALQTYPLLDVVESVGWEVRFEPPYKVSPIDNTNKFTKKCKCCLALALLGEETHSTQPISFLGHFSPSILDNHSSFFFHTLPFLLRQFRQKTKPQGRFAALAGGYYGREAITQDNIRDYRAEYTEMIKLLSKGVQNVLDLPTWILRDPKKSKKGHTDLYLLSGIRQIIIIEDSPAGA